MLRQLICICFFFIGVHSFEPSEIFVRDSFLDDKSDDPGKYRLFWKVVNDDIIFEAHVQTLGWLGLGFSPTGGMTGADIIVGGVKDGKPYIYDLHATGTSKPLVDNQQNTEALFGAENATHTVLKFKRKLSTCDLDDYQISNDTVKLIWAYNPKDAESQSQFDYHSQRGAKSTMLLEASKAARAGKTPADSFVLDVNSTNFEIPGDTDTTYMCKIIKLPSRAKAHIYMYEPVIQKGNEKFVHHILIYHCLYNMEQFVDKQEPCFSKDHTRTNEMYKCVNRYLAGWAVGAENVVYPDNLGYPFFDPDDMPYMLLEIHYDNPKMLSGVKDSSGLRLHLTNTLRPTEIGSLVLGFSLGPEHMIIPPGQNKVTMTSVCDSQCTTKIAENGYNVIGGFLHEHVRGTAVRLRWIRNGVELPPLMEDNYYDFNYQEQRMLTTPKTILRGDTLIVECDFKTTNDQNATFGGHSTREEMCLIFLDYYPKSESMIGCFGGPNAVGFAEAMGATIPDPTVPNELNGPAGKFASSKEYALAVNWKEDQSMTDGHLSRSPKGEIFQEKINTGPYYEICIMKKNKTQNESSVAVQPGRNQTADMGNVAFEYIDNLRLLKPRVPYVKPSVCGTVPINTGTTVSMSGGSTNMSGGNMSSGLTNTNNDTPTNGSFTNWAIIDKDNTYRLSWKYDDDNITFEIQAQATGWVGLGFSPTGGMTGADIIVAFIDKAGLPQISDRFAESNTFPKEDTHQDVTILYARKNNSHMTVGFTRKRITCDQQDMPLQEDTVKVIYAMSNVVPEDKNRFEMHQSSQRGTKSMRFFDGPRNEKPLPRDVRMLDIAVSNVRVPDDKDTVYYCQALQLPDYQKHHIIRIDPMIQEGNSDVVHHIILYGCADDVSQYIGKGQNCFNLDGEVSNDDEPSLMGMCNVFITAWAVGGESVIYPDDVGIPIFETGGYKQVMLEMHYDNSQFKKNKIDSSGIRLYLTPTLRPVEGGPFNFDIQYGAEYIQIPPNQPNYTYYSYCPSDCTTSLPINGVTVFGALLHTHLAGRKIRVHHFRNGVQLPDMFADDHYDFNYQSLTLKPKNVRIMPGDELLLECTYDTTGRKNITFGGFSTMNEMCSTFIAVYPRPAKTGFYCSSFLDFSSEWKMFNAPNYNQNMSRFVLPNGANQTARDFAMKNIKFDTADSINKYQSLLRDGQKVIICNTPADKNKSSGIVYGDIQILQKKGIPKFTSTRQADTVCSKDSPATTGSPLSAAVQSKAPETTTKAVKPGGNGNSHRLCMLIFVLSLMITVVTYVV